MEGHIIMHKKSPDSIVEQAYENIVFSIKSAEEGYYELLDNDLADLSNELRLRVYTYSQM